ncbi:MAG: pilus assembly protein [Erythrobacter sp.]
MSQRNRKGKSFLQALLRDPTANTIVISAAALIPLMAMVGGSVDASRYYMAAARLQAACDAGALAARRAMTTSSFTTVHQNIANNFFDNNFPVGLYNTTGRSRSFTATSRGIVNGTASAVLPATIMSAFGYSTFNLTATCSADVNISNTDIMFVLDVTGSMTATDAGDGMSRIQALRNAVMNFYDTVKAGTSSSAQVRFGAVPYAMSVNVGNVLPREYLASSHTYESRRFINEFISEQQEWIPRDLNHFPNPTQDQQRYNNQSNGTANNSDRNRCESTNRGTFRRGEIVYEISGNTYTLGVFPGANNATNRAGCRANVRRSRQVYSYEPRTFDVSAFKTGGTVVTDTGVNGTNVSHTWNGCIEEAETVTTSNFNPVPPGAFDLDINLVPATEAQRWKPALPEAIFSRPSPAVVVTDVENYTRPSRSCATPSFRLTDITRPQLQAYVNSLVATGNTYHDIGMIWGARLISPNGMFAADNTSAPNGDPISRHIVFMTDGLLEPSLTIYGMYGVERMQRIITGNGNATTQRNNHEARFQAACRAAKNENITIWVVAFGTTLTQSLRNCSTPGRAYEASNSAQLEAAFQEIAQKIAALRLTS